MNHVFSRIHVYNFGSIYSSVCACVCSLVRECFMRSYMCRDVSLSRKSLLNYSIVCQKFHTNYTVCTSTLYSIQFTPQFQTNSRACMLVAPYGWKSSERKKGERPYNLQLHCVYVCVWSVHRVTQTLFQPSGDVRLLFEIETLSVLKISLLFLQALTASHYFQIEYFISFDFTHQPYTQNISIHLSFIAIQFIRVCKLLKKVWFSHFQFCTDRSRPGVSMGPPIYNALCWT